MALRNLPNNLGQIVSTQPAQAGFVTQRLLRVFEQLDRRKGLCSFKNRGLQTPSEQGLSSYGKFIAEEIFTPPDETSQIARGSSK
jgi:hypothetical protein